MASVGDVLYAAVRTEKHAYTEDRVRTRRVQRNQEVRTLMTVVAMGAAHNQKSIVLTPVATG